MVGRPDAIGDTATTSTIDLAVTNMAPWQFDDRLTLDCWGMGGFAS